MSDKSGDNGAGLSNLDSVAGLLRGFAVDFLTAHNPEVAPRIMTPEYRLTIGGHVLDGRDTSYLPATGAQLEQFPGLCVTVHDVLVGERVGAMRFTEHGASRRHENLSAAWAGVALFRTDGERLRMCFAEEDYFARKRQLASGVCDPVEAPLVAPWDTNAEPGNPTTEEVARAWLGELRVAADVISDSSDSPSPDPAPSTLIDVLETRVVELFSAGSRAAFHVEHRGSYAGGFSGIDSRLVGSPVILRAAGLLSTDAGQVVAARVVTDRLGLYHALKQLA